MRRFRISSMDWAGILAIAILAAPTRARADLTLYDKDGWSFHTEGLVAAHFQLTKGDGDPSTTHGVLVGGQILPQGANDTRDNTLTLSRVRSGFIGSQFGFGANRQISDTVHIESLLAVSLYDISSNRGQSLPKDVDFREAWAAVVSPYGTFKFGRMFSIFGSASAPVVLLAYKYAVGNPCTTSEATIACASVGAGPLYAGYDAQLRYITPRLGGFEFQVSVSDPVVGGPTYRMTPLPRFDGELNFEQSFNPQSKLRVIGQGVYEQLQRIDMNNALQKGNAAGVIGSAVFDISGLSVGAGGWTGSGIGVRTFWEAPDPGNALAYDSTGELRIFRGYFGNVAYDYHGTTLAAGGGIVYVRSSATDSDPTASVDVLSKQADYHVVLTQKIDALILTAEYTRWMSQWHFGETQNLTFAGVGANFAW